MEHYSVPMMADNGFNIVSGASSNDDNTSNTTTNNHHNGDPMLAAGDTAVAAIIHQAQNKPTTIKNCDYTTYNKCIQQPTLLDHRPINNTVEAGVSLSGICDLKFTNSPLLSTSQMNVDSSFKNISLLPAVETNHTHPHLNKTTTSSINVSHTQEMCFDPMASFPNLNFNRENVSIDDKTIQGDIDSQQQGSTPPYYLTLNSNTTAQNTTQVPVPSISVISSHSSCGPPSLVNLRNHAEISIKNKIENHISNDAALDPSTSVITTGCSTYFENNACSSSTNLSLFNENYRMENNANNLTVMGETGKSRLNISNTNHRPCLTKVDDHISTTTVTLTTKVPEITASQNSLKLIGDNSNISQTNDFVTKDVILPNPKRQGESSCIISNEIISKHNDKNTRILDSTLTIVESSSDCDSLTPTTSDDEDNEAEFINLDKNDKGYQENTSSNSQQSANGSGGGSGNGVAGGGSSGGGNSAYAVIQSGGGGLVNGSSGTGSTSGSNPSMPGGYMTLLPPVVGTASSSGHMGSTPSGTCASAGASGDIIDFKHLFEELCPVCGDKVSGYHYGLLTCESCKGFFKRTVQNKKVYTCVAERSCHIDKTQRKRCPYCRFQKCLEVGMKLEAVRADRMRGGRNKFGPMYKRDRARKLQLMRQRQIALQALRTSIGSVDMKPTPVSPGYQQAYPNMNIKQEIQIPQVSSLTQSPDSSPSPIAIALGQVNASTGVIATPNNAGGSGGVSNNNNSSGNGGNTSSENVNRGGTSGCQDDVIGSLHTASESKICFDSGTHPSSTADSMIEPLRVSPMIRDFVQSIDDREWQTQLFALLQKQTYNQVEVDLFELMCKVLDQNLFSQVDWARNTVFFKDLKVDDQMKLLQHSWSDMLVLDHLHQRIHNGLPDETQLNNGQVFNLLSLGLLGVPQLADYFNELQNKLQDLKFDMGDYVCMKFLILLNPDVRGIINKKTVVEGHQNVQAALLDYTLTCYPSVTDKFRRLLNILPDIHAMAARGEEHLYSKHCAGSAPTQTLLMEMLHAKRKV